MYYYLLSHESLEVLTKQTTVIIAVLPLCMFVLAVIFLFTGFVFAHVFCEFLGLRFLSISVFPDFFFSTPKEFFCIIKLICSAEEDGVQEVWVCGL